MFWRQYADDQEKVVAKTLQRIAKADTPKLVKPLLSKLITTDLIRLSLYSERRYKGYKHLSPKKREEHYKNANIIIDDFKNFLEPLSNSFVSPFDRMMLVMQYLHKYRNFEYRKQSSFEKLLVNPKQQNFIGDCNQIVTLALGLYSEQWKNLTGIQLKIIEGHICIHINGKDIEATTGEVHHYKKYVFITHTDEIFSTNLLDIHDISEERYQIPPQIFLEGSQMAKICSSHTQIVDQNITASLLQISNTYIEKGDFERAWNYIKKTKRKDLETYCIQKALQYYMEKKVFSVGEKWAKKASLNDKKVFFISWGIDLLHKRKYKQARTKFTTVSYTEGEKISYEYELSELSKSFQKCKYIADYKNQKTNIKKALILAQKINNQSLIKNYKQILSQI